MKKGKFDLSSDTEGNQIKNWVPSEYLETATEEYMSFANGFLNCEPSGWFPGLLSHWDTFAHSIGVNINIADLILSVSSSVTISEDMKSLIHVALLDDEPVGIYINEYCKNTVCDVVIPDAVTEARDIVVEYLARRFITSLSKCWSGPKMHSFSFDDSFSYDLQSCCGQIKIILDIEGHECVVSLLLGRKLVEIFDQLWKRQLASQNKTTSIAGNIRLEIAELAVSQTMLSNYLISGTVVDLETPVSDSIIVKVDNQPLIKAKLLTCKRGDDKEYFAIKNISGNLVQTKLPEGTSRLSIELNDLSLDNQLLQDFIHPNAVADTGILVGDEVKLLIQGEVVGKAKLKIFEDRFAIEVL